MDPDQLRQIIAPAAGILMTFLLRPLLINRNDEAAGKRIAAEHPLVMTVTKALFFVGIAPALIIYGTGILPDNDWRGLGIGMLFCILLPLLFTVAYARITHTPLADLYTATREGVPRPVVVVLFAIFIIPGVWAAVSLLLEFVF